MKTFTMKTLTMTLTKTCEKLKIKTKPFQAWRVLVWTQYSMVSSMKVTRRSSRWLFLLHLNQVLKIQVSVLANTWIIRLLFDEYIFNLMYFHDLMFLGNMWHIHIFSYIRQCVTFSYIVIIYQAMWTAVTGGKGNGRELDEMETVEWTSSYIYYHHVFSIIYFPSYIIINNKFSIWLEFYNLNFFGWSLSLLSTIMSIFCIVTLFQLVALVNHVCGTWED